MAIEALPLPKTINGLPFHPLIVHAVVVLLPLTVIGAIGISLWPAMRRYLGLLVLLFGVISLILVPITVNSGEQFRDRSNAFIQNAVRQHESWASNLFPWTLALALLLLLTMVVDFARRMGPVLAAAGPDADLAPVDGSVPLGGGGVGLATRVEAPATAPNMTRLDRAFARIVPAQLRSKTAFLRVAQPVLAVATIVVAVVLVYFVYKTGDSGAKVVWGTGG